MDDPPGPGEEDLDGESVQKGTEEEDAGKILIDSSLIQSATIQDEDAELGNLGLRLYDQSTLESGIRLQVDAAMEKMEAKRQKLNAEKRIRTLRNRIGQLSQKCQRLKSAMVTAPRTYEELQRQKRQQAELADLREELGQLRAELSCLETGGTSQDADGDQSAAALLSGGGESELEAKVRLGEVTPFGTDLSAVTTESTSLSARALDSSIVRSPPGSSGTSCHNATTSLAGTSIDQSELVKPRPSAGVSQSALAVSRPSAGISQSDDEYVPSDETADESDEAYVPTDEEGERDQASAGRGRPATKGAKRKRGSKAASKAAKRVRRAPDDGDPEAYAARIREWRRERREERLLRIEQGIIDDDDEEERCVEFDGGFRCPASLWDRLFKYQQVCVRWLWELHQQRCGGVLGDEMGLGKTIQVIAFLAGLSRSNVRWGGERGLGPVLVMAPATVLHQWVAEFHRWWPPLRVAVLHESGSHAGSKASLVRQMSRSRGVLLTSYSAMTSHKELLVAQDWHYVILDEGHKIRNPDAQITLAVKQVRTPHRVILSGSPLQNNLRELWSLFDFVFPGKLGTLPVFVSQFSVPITQGGYTNASDTQVVTAFRCAKVLRDTIAPYLLRRMKADVQQTLQLPTKNEQVLFCRLTDVQRQLYQDYINSDSLRRILQGSMKVFVGLIALRKLCNHPDLLTGTPTDSEDLTEDRDRDRDRAPADRPDHFGHWKRAGKMVVLSALLDIWRKQEHKVLLFTQSRQMLSILESFVSGRGYSYLRMDGGTSVGSRQTLIRRFNTEPDIFCFLLTTRVGGLGVNLTGANRIIIYDPDWNPSTDQQARERAWRIGQDRHVTIYRLLTAGTIEEKIYHRQIFKQFLTNRVLKDPKQQRFFKTNDLHDLFTLTEEAPEGGGEGEGTGRGPAAASSQSTTETAEIFSGSQVSAAALEARRQREKKLRRQRQAELAKEEERRRQKLLEKARKLNQKLFTSGEAKKNGGKKKQKNGEKKQKNGEKKKKKKGIGSEKELGRVEGGDGLETKSAGVEMSNAAVELTKEENGDTCTPEDTAGVVVNGEMVKNGEVSATTAGQKEESGEREDDKEKFEEGENADDGKKLIDGVEEEDRERVEVEAGAKDEKREEDAKEPEDLESLEEGELVEDDETVTLDSSSQDRTADHPTPSTSAAAGAWSGDHSAVQLEKPSSSAGPPDDRASERRAKKKGKEEQDERKRRREKEDRRKRGGEERERRKGGEREGRRKRRRRRGDPLLGEVEGLVDSEVYRPPQTDQDANTDRSQDDYVLTRLFKKSGVHSAVRHDVIEGHGTPDGAILEAEATKVAREAVAALRASRREVRAAEIGTPTWTGQSGRAGIPARPRFGQKKNPLLAAKPVPPPPASPAKKIAPALPALFAPDAARVSRPSYSSASTSASTASAHTAVTATASASATASAAMTPAPEGNLFGGAAALGVGSSSATNADAAPLSSAQLLARIRRRAAGEDGAEAVEVAQEHADLLADIRNFVAFQTSTNGRASTKELLGEFKARLPAEQTPLFKALLNEICEFERGADKTGWWVLREELR